MSVIGSIVVLFVVFLCSCLRLPLSPSLCIITVFLIVIIYISLSCFMDNVEAPMRGEHVCNLELHQNIGIKHGFPCINISQVPWEVLKTEAEGRGFQQLPRDLANVNALKNHVRSLLLHKNWKHLLHFALFLHFFVSPFHRCLANVISTYYARSRAGQYTSRDGSNSVAPVRAYWKFRSRALTARELPC